MATYEYLCSTCGKRFDVVQSMKDDALTQCPEEVCEQESPGHGDVSRVISGGGGVIYKGEGFYLTDYVHNKDASRKSESPSTSTPAASSEKSDSTGASANTSPSTTAPSSSSSSSSTASASSSTKTSS